MTHLSRLIAALSGAASRYSNVAGALALLCAVFSFSALAADTVTSPPLAGSTTQSAGLEDLVGRIALYPDDLVAIILPASTFPLQIVQAERFLAKRKSEPNTPVDEKWDDAVKSLVNYPEVIASMSGDLDWTAALGEAVVENQGAVLDAIQAFRRKAQAAGNLKSDSKQVIVVEKEIIKIEPADPQVVYVPQYAPSSVVVYGSPAWGYYPTPYPSYYYPYAPGAAFATGLIWGAAIGAAWNGNRYGANYGGNANINIDRNTNINTGDRNRGDGAARPKTTGGSNSKPWTSNKQKGQVSSSVGSTSRSSRAGDSARAGSPSARNTAASGGADRSAQRGGGSSGGGAAFDGYGSGRQTQMDSSRGAASRSSASASPRSTASSGGGSRGGGGGGGRGGGGGGRGGGGRR